MADSITLNCLILIEEPKPDHIFSIQTSPKTPVVQLKDLIQNKRCSLLVDSTMTLWKLKTPICVSTDGWVEKVNSLTLQPPNVERLNSPGARISKYFPAHIDDGYLHIIVQRPTIPLPTSIETFTEPNFPCIIREYPKSSKKYPLTDLTLNNIKHVALPNTAIPSFTHAYANDFYQMLSKKATYTMESPVDPELPHLINVLKTKLGENFANHFIEAQSNTQPLMGVNDAYSYVHAVGDRFRNSIGSDWTAGVQETCFAGTVVDPALMDLDNNFNRNSVVTAIPVRSRSGNEPPLAWQARPDFHVSYGAETARCATVIGETKSAGQSEQDAMVKMALMCLHAWRLSQLYVDIPQQVILSVYISQGECSVYMFYKNPDVEEGFYMQCILHQRNMFEVASNNVGFLRMMFNVARNGSPISDEMKPRSNEYTGLGDVLQQIADSTPAPKRRNQGEESPEQEDASDVQGPSGADNAQLTAARYTVIDDPTLRKYPHILRLASNGHANLVAKWTADDEEHRLLQFLQSAKSEIYQNLVIPVVEFLGPWIIMPCYTDVRRLRSLSIEGYFNLRLRLVEAVAFLHEQGVVHRDLKIANLVVQFPTEPHGVLNITDFGVAALYKDGDDLFYDFCGSWGCTAPEVDDGREYNPKYADIFALGLVLGYLARLAKYDDPLPWTLMSRVPSSRPTAAALFIELSASKLNHSKRKESPGSDEIPFSKRRIMDSGFALMSHDQGVEK